MSNLDIGCLAFSVVLSHICSTNRACELIDADKNDKQQSIIKSMENVDLFKAMLEILREILMELKKEHPSPSTPVKSYDFLNDLIDGVDVKSILKISESTLYRLKRSKSIHTILIGKREYYSRAEIIRLINAFKK